MSRSLNKVMLIGYVGREPEIRTTGTGLALARLSLATTRRSGLDTTDWHRLTFFGPLVDVVEQHVHRGDRLYIEGRLQYSESRDEEGKTLKWCDVVVDKLVLFTSSTTAGRG